MSITQQIPVWLFLAFFLPVLASASGIAVSPSSLVIETNVEQTSTAYFTVSNPDSEVQAFEIYPDNYPNLIRIDPPVFTLNPGGIKKVSVKFIRQNPGPTDIKKTNISVLGHPLSEKNIQITVGAKISLTITDVPVKTKTSNQNLLIGLVALGSLISAAMWQKLRKD